MWGDFEGKLSDTFILFKMLHIYSLLYLIQYCRGKLSAPALLGTQHQFLIPDGLPAFRIPL